MYRIFFIHSSAKGHVGCFHVGLGLVNWAAMNTGMHISSLDICPAEGLQDHTVALFLVF